MGGGGDLPALTLTLTLTLPLTLTLTLTLPQAPQLSAVRLAQG